MSNPIGPKSGYVPAVNPITKGQGGNASGQGREMHEGHEVWLAIMAQKAGEMPFAEAHDHTLSTADRLAGGEGQAAQLDTSQATHGGLNDELAASDAAARFRLGLGHS